MRVTSRRSIRGVIVAGLVLPVMLAAVADGQAAVLTYARAPNLHTAVQGAVYVRGLGGGARVVTLTSHGRAQAVAPDARSVLYLAALKDWQPQRLIMATVRAGKVRRRVLAQDVSAAVFSPDSRSVAIIVRPSKRSKEHLQVLSLATGRTQDIYAGSTLGMTFSPDSQSLAYVRNWGDETTEDYGGDIYVAPLGAHAQRRLTTDGRSREPLWGAPGIAYTRPRERTAGDMAATLNLVQPDGSGRRVLLTDNPSAPDPDGYQSVAWSQDGSRLLVNKVAFDDLDALIVDVNAPLARRLVPAMRGVAGRGFSADAQSVLAETGYREFKGIFGTHNVVQLPAAGGAMKVLAKGFIDSAWTSLSQAAGPA